MPSPVTYPIWMYSPTLPPVVANNAAQQNAYVAQGYSTTYVPPYTPPTVPPFNLPNFIGGFESFAELVAAYTYEEIPAGTFPVAYTEDLGLALWNGSAWTQVSAGTAVALSSPDKSVTVQGSPGTMIALTVSQAIQMGAAAALAGGGGNVLPGTYLSTALPAASANPFKFASTSDLGAVFSNGNAWQVLYNPTSATLAISTGTPLTQGTASVAYSVPLAATQGAPPYTWSLVGTFGTSNTVTVSTSGVLAIASPSAGTTYAVVQVEDTTGARDQFIYAIPINASAQLAGTPTFSPPAGNYTATQTVAISCSTPGATIYYTTDGSTPTTSSSVYSTPLTVSSSKTVQAIATATGFTQSGLGSAAYTITVPVAATPTFSPVAGTYTSTQTVTISCSTPSPTIYYTTNGTTPTTGSTQYSGPISVSTSEVVQAIATASGYSQSAVGNASYTISAATQPAATPTFSPAAGNYTATQSVAISCSTAGSSIFYTTDGSTPTTGSTLYTGPISVSSTSTINAIATATGFTTSGVGSAAYTITTPVAATPTFSPGAGTYSSTQTVTISSATAGSTIHYTTDGSIPTSGSTTYSTPISVAATETVQAIAIHSGYTNSAVGNAAYTISTAPPAAAATPTFSPVAGNYTSTQSVVLACSTPGATIYYTTNGSTPTVNSSVYSGPLTVSATTTVNAIATATGYSQSAVGSATYNFNVQAATPTFSPGAGVYTAPQSVAITTTTPGATIYYTTNGTTPTINSSVYSGAISVGAATVKAIAVASGFINSNVGSALYQQESANYATVIAGSSAVLTDASGNTWGIAQQNIVPVQSKLTGPTTIAAGTTFAATLATLPSQLNSVVFIGSTSFLPSNAYNITGVVDNVGNVFVKQQQAIADSGIANAAAVDHWLLQGPMANAPSGTYTVTATYGTAFSASQSAQIVTLMELSGISGPDQSNNATSTTVAVETISVVNANPNIASRALVIASAIMNNHSTTTASGMTAPPGNNNVSGAFASLYGYDGVSSSGTFDAGTSAGYKIVTAIETSAAQWAWTVATAQAAAIVSSYQAQAQVSINGAIDNTTSQVVEIALVNGDIWQKNAANRWFYATSPTSGYLPVGGTLTSPLQSTSVAINSLGINAPNSEGSALSYNGIPMHWNLVRDGRGFTTVGAPSTQTTLTTGTSHGVTTTGWPATDFLCFLYEGTETQSWQTGTFTCGFIGTGSETITAYDNATISNVSHNAAPAYTTFNLTTTGGPFGFSVSGTTGGCVNVFAFLPGYSGGNTIDNPASATSIWSGYANYFSQYNFLRFMTLANGNYWVAQATSAARRTPSNTQSNQGWFNANAEGYPVEWFAAACVACNNAYWATMPLTLDSSGTYVTAALTAIAAIYTPTAANPLYIEISDEVWNSGNPPQASFFAACSAMFGGTSNTQLGQYYAYLLNKIGVIAQTVFGSNYQYVKMVCAWQASYGYAGGVFAGCISYMKSQYGALTWLQALSVGAYMYRSTAQIAPTTASSVATIESQLQAVAETIMYTDGIENLSILARANGLQMVGYELGWEISAEVGQASAANCGTAIMDLGGNGGSIGMTAVENTYWQQVFNAGYTAACRFDGSVQGIGKSIDPEYGISILYSTLTAGNAPRSKSMLTFTNGQYVPTRNVISASGQSITATADNLGGTLAGNAYNYAPHYGVAGYVSYPVYNPNASSNTYNLNVQFSNTSTSAGSTSVEVNGTVLRTGVVIPASLTTSSPAVNCGSVTLIPGWNYVCLGTGSNSGSQADITPNSLTFVSASVPPQAAAVGYNTVTFGPQVTLNSNWFLWSLLGATTPAGAAVQNADGTVSLPGGTGTTNYNAYGANIATAYKSGNSWKGVAFGGGFYIEGVFSFTPTLNASGNYGLPFPAFWAEDINYSSGGAAATAQTGGFAGYDRYAEFDFFQWPHNTVSYYAQGDNIDWWGTTAAGPQQHNIQQPAAGSETYLGGASMANNQTYGVLWVPATATSNGYIKSYLNGVQVVPTNGQQASWEKYNASLAPPPVAGTTAGSYLDVAHLCLIFGTDVTCPMKVTSCTVWQASAANNLVQ